MIHALSHWMYRDLIPLSLIISEEQWSCTDRLMNSNDLERISLAVDLTGDGEPDAIWASQVLLVP